MGARKAKDAVKIGSMANRNKEKEEVVMRVIAGASRLCEKSYNLFFRFGTAVEEEEEEEIGNDAEEAEEEQKLEKEEEEEEKMQMRRKQRTKRRN